MHWWLRTRVTIVLSKAEIAVLRWPAALAENGGAPHRTAARLRPRTPTPGYEATREAAMAASREADDGIRQKHGIRRRMLQEMAERNLTEDRTDARDGATHS